MNKIWYVIIKNKEEGPFTAEELFYDARVSLDTLVWKEGFGSWVPLKMVPELRQLFEENEPASEEEEDEEGESEQIAPQEELALDYSKEPNFIFLWVIIGAILILYLIYELNG